MISRTAYLLVFITGFLAIGYEIIWFRIVGIFVKASPYVFSSVLFVYLIGIAAGSYAMNKFIQRHKANRRNLFFLLQFMIGFTILAIILLYFYLTKLTPLRLITEASFRELVHPAFLPFDTFRGFLRSLYYMLDIFFWAGLFVLIPSILMGASFPLISSLALKQPDKEGAAIGKVYFFNIAGNVLGGLVTGFILLPLLSTEITLLIFIFTGILFGLFIKPEQRNAATNLYKPSWTAGIANRLPPNMKISARGILIRYFQSKSIIIAGSIFIGIILFPKPGQLYSLIHTSPGPEYIQYLEEDVDGVVVTYKHGEKLRNYINGIAHGWRPLYLYHFEAGEAISYCPEIKNVLVIGYGNGTITEIALKIPSVEKVTVIEINNTLIKNLRKINFFAEMLNDDKLELMIDDGRRFLLRNHQQYDLILIDPLRTKTAYSNNLYSQEFFTMLNDHLTEQGVLMVWIDEFKVMPKTIMSAFNHVLQYQFLCLASDSPFVRNQKMVETLLAQLTDKEISGMNEYQGSYLGDESYIEMNTGNYPINRDFKPVCEYYIGLALGENFNFFTPKNKVDNRIP